MDSHNANQRQMQYITETNNKLSTSVWCNKKRNTHSGDEDAQYTSKIKKTHDHDHAIITGKGEPEKL